MEAFQAASKPFTPGAIFFVTLRLRDALPEHFVQNLGLQFYSKQVAFAQHSDAENGLHQARKRLFTPFDAMLDLCKYGQNLLQIPELTEVVEDVVRHFERQTIDFLAVKILPNHLHCLLQFKEPAPSNIALDEFDQLEYKVLRDFVRNFQTETGSRMQQVLATLKLNEDPLRFQKRNASGLAEPNGSIWHPRSFDFQIRDAIELENVTRYIAQNSAEPILEPEKKVV